MEGAAQIELKKGLAPRVLNDTTGLLPEPYHPQNRMLRPCHSIHHILGRLPLDTQSHSPLYSPHRKASSYQLWNLGGGVSLADFRKDIIIDLFNEAGQKVMSFKLYRCWPSEYIALGELNANDTCVALESLTLQHEGWKRDYDFAEPKEPVFTDRFGTNAGSHPFVILGDFNDYMQSDDQGEPGINELVEWHQVVHVVDRLPEDDRWTHYFKGRGALEPAYHQLDYLLLSGSLAEHNPHPPHIERRGLPKRANRYPGERFSGIGQNSPKASDHCPIVMELQF